MSSSNIKSKKPCLAFIGRWCPLHKGHTWIIKNKIQTKNNPVLILVRDTSYDNISAEDRANIIKKWLTKPKRFFINST